MPDKQFIKENLDNFQNDLDNINKVDIIRKYVLFGRTFLINEEKYYELKNEIAHNFNIHPNEVMLVGSAKLGFSFSENLSKSKSRYRHFSEESDLDIAIVSNNLFDRYWDEIFNKKIQTKFQWKDDKSFKDYFFRGWINPTKIPNDLDIKNDWFEYFRELSNSRKYGEYQINAGIYRNWQFFETYQSSAVQECIDERILR
ncbi:MAG: hypothetical protein KGZ62_01915 [Sulfurimonas sp.]|nr:hypothetical protein [Sulfurimonas sp.]